MSAEQIQILLQVDREIALHHFLRDYFIPALNDRGYTLRNLLRAMVDCAFDRDYKAVAHRIWDAVAKLDEHTLLETSK
ncbi:hypothetical protein [Scytonema hofmannii]|nr:hypothetical protein [Scytonema hofmannii]